VSATTFGAECTNCGASLTQEVDKNGATNLAFVNSKGNSVAKIVLSPDAGGVKSVGDESKVCWLDRGEEGKEKDDD
jgi:hypothetical protein